MLQICYSSYLEYFRKVACLNMKNDFPLNQTYTKITVSELLFIA